MTDELKFADYRNRLNIQDVLIDAGYTLNRRDGLRYPSYVRLDSEGKRIRGDKFIITANGNCCFQPPVMKTFSVTSFIWEHPHLFPESAQGYKDSDLVNMVCCRLLNEPVEIRKGKIVEPEREHQSFDLSKYQITEFKGGKDGNFRQFYPYFAQRGIDLPTQSAFKNGFVIASMQGSNGKTYSNLSFPMRIPNKEDVVGLEQRGLKQKDGSSYKGMARGSNASEGMWIASPRNTKLSDAKLVFVFESAYDAMAFYQILTGKDSNLDQQDKDKLKSAVYVSTGGNPSYNQMDGLIKNAPNANFHLGFDNDVAGRQFEKNFRDIAYKQSPVNPNNVPSDMKAFIETFKGQIKSTSELTSISEEQSYELPKDLQAIYGKYESARDEAMEAHYSPFLCKEDKEDAANKMHDAFVTFRTALFEKLNIREGQDLGGVKIIREEPSEGYKDFNDELLGKNQHSLTDLIETVFDDGSGVDYTMEEQDEVEENEKEKHHGFRR